MSANVGLGVWLVGRLCLFGSGGGSWGTLIGSGMSKSVWVHMSIIVVVLGSLKLLMVLARQLDLWLKLRSFKLE